VIDLFERRFSVDETVKRHKPAQEAYHSVAAAFQLDPGDICLIASHVWDTIGGRRGWLADRAHPPPRERAARLICSEHSGQRICG
jgi:FMN phosphatase YigB (HAD superfamily)